MIPYQIQPDKAFWKKAAQHADFDLLSLYEKSFDIGAKTRVATAGSCFAQHIGRYLRHSGATLLDVEPAAVTMSPETTARFGYGLFSARYGNIYTARQLLQIVQDSVTAKVHADAIWMKDGRAYDALRPGVEPEGLDSAEEVAAHRTFHLVKVRELIETMDVLIFTLGLTEAWMHRETSRVYPVCPGVVAGRFDPTLHAFINFDYPAVRKDIEDVRALLKSINPHLKLMLTVSPVPLAATATPGHVLTATTYSKATLRAVAGDLAAAHEDIAYFPSYEIITGGPFAGRFMAEDLRSVRPEGVQTVMKAFFAAHPGLAPHEEGLVTEEARSPVIADTSADDDLVCEEQLLEAFAK